MHPIVENEKLETCRCNSIAAQINMIWQPFLKYGLSLLHVDWGGCNYPIKQKWHTVFIKQVDSLRILTLAKSQWPEITNSTVQNSRGYFLLFMLKHCCPPPSLRRGSGCPRKPARHSVWFVLDGTGLLIHSNSAHEMTRVTYAKLVLKLGPTLVTVQRLNNRPEW